MKYVTYYNNTTGGRRTELQPQTMHIENLVKSGCVIPEIYLQTDRHRQTDRYAATTNNVLMLIFDQKLSMLIKVTV